MARRLVVGGREPSGCEHVGRVVPVVVLARGAPRRVRTQIARVHEPPGVGLPKVIEHGVGQERADAVLGREDRRRPGGAVAVGVVGGIGIEGGFVAIAELVALRPQEVEPRAGRAPAW